MTENAVVGSYNNSDCKIIETKKIVENNIKLSFYENLVDVLLREANIYEEILTYEKKKNTAIQDQDVDSLQKINLKQENLLQKRDAMEEDRNQKFSVLEKKFHGTKIKRLNDLLKLDISQQFFNEISNINHKIHSNIKQLKELVDINHTIITYNTTFFHQLLENVVHRSAHSCVYNLNDRNDQAKEVPESSKPIFLDANC